MPNNKKYAVVALIPAIHSGYLSFFNKFRGLLYVVGKDFIQDFPHIERDLRTPHFSELKKMILSLGIFEDVIELNRENIQTIPDSLEIVMADDDIMKGIREKYISERPVSFENIFLRWTRQISTTEFEVPSGRIITETEVEKELMGRALEIAPKSADWWRQVGAVICKEGEIIIEACNKNMPSDYSLDAHGDPRSNFDAGERFDLVNTIHAEAHAIALAAKRGISIDGALLYVTTFPCPACARLIAKAGIKKVYYTKGYSLLDAEKILSDFGVEIVLVKQ
jgi:dCMP deaminase